MNRYEILINDSEESEKIEESEKCLFCDGSGVHFVFASEPPIVGKCQKCKGTGRFKI
jgi:DnaJ-class molecular chaperone